MTALRNRVAELMPLTISETVTLAEEEGVRAVDVVLIESEITTGLEREALLGGVMKEYEHNLKALAIGESSGESVLLGRVAALLAAKGTGTCFKDSFLDRALLHTLAAQVGNHCIGLRPCAGTGDSCPYAGFIRALQEDGRDDETIAEIAALMLKIGGLFRVGKVTTGCNMEGFGAGAASIAAATVTLEGGTPRQMENAMVLALSPTIGVPCTPRVLVPGLCTTHVGGAILIGMYAARVVMATDMSAGVPFDVMLAMAAQIHVESAKALVPTVVEYMEPFFRRKACVEALVSQNVHEAEEENIRATLKMAAERAKELARGAGNILNTLGEAVVGGSSQAVGSPTNAARIAHQLLGEANVKKVIIELYPELFARRSINVPGILMGAVYGSSTSDHEMYGKAVEMVSEAGISVEIRQADEQGLQRITLETDEGSVMVDTLNRGGGRLKLRDAHPSLEEAQRAAEKLGVVLTQ